MHSTNHILTQCRARHTLVREHTLGNHFWQACSLAQRNHFWQALLAWSLLNLVKSSFKSSRQARCFLWLDQRRRYMHNTTTRVNSTAEILMLPMCRDCDQFCLIWELINPWFSRWLDASTSAETLRFGIWKAAVADKRCKNIEVNRKSIMIKTSLWRSQTLRSLCY